MAYVPNSGSVVAFQSSATNFTGQIGYDGSVAQVFRMDQAMTGSNLGLVTHAMIHGATTAGGGSFVDVKVSPSGAVQVGGTVTIDSIQSGNIVVTQGTSPWVVAPNNSSLIALQLAGSVLATSTTVNTGNSSVQVLNFPTTQNVSGSVVASGTVGATQSGSWSASVGGTVSVLGTVPVTQSGAWTVSVVGLPTTQNVSGSVVAFGFPTNQNVSGSVVSFQGTNPWLSSVWLATPGTAFRYTGSVVSTSVTLIQASASGKKSYITDFWVANTGAATTLITFKDGSTSILGYTIAPATSGSNSPGIEVPHVTAPSQDLVFQATTGTSVLYLTVNGYQI